MGWALYNTKTNLYDGIYSHLSDARFFRMILTVSWKGSDWEIIEVDHSPDDRFHGDHKELLLDTFGESQHDLLIKVQKMDLSFTNVCWVDDILIFETVLDLNSE